MADKSSEPRTGVFFSKAGKDYVVLWQGLEVARYGSIADFIEAHQRGLDALEEDQDNLLAKYYQSIGIATGRTADSANNDKSDS